MTLVQVGWFCGERHRHEKPSRGIACGEFKFTEEIEPGCEGVFVPAYVVGPVPDDWCLNAPDLHPRTPDSASSPEVEA